MSAPLDKESEEYKAFCKKKSDAAKRRWNDPEERRRQSESISKSWEDEVVRKLRTSGYKKSWESEDTRNHRVVGICQSWDESGRREKQSSVAIKRWNDPKERENQSLLILETVHGGIWYGNVTHYDNPQYCEKFNKDLKERVRAFREYVCFECGAVQNVDSKTKLSVHHVHYDKKMCCNGSPQDVVPLCQSCHSKTLHNRDYWEEHFTEMIYNNDPMGKCFFTKEEMREYKKLH